MPKGIYQRTKNWTWTKHVCECGRCKTCRERVNYARRRARKDAQPEHAQAARS